VRKSTAEQIAGRKCGSTGKLFILRTLHKG
jgi:hypothetical protein